MARNLIGTVTTDSNGEATFTYTGGGLGRIGFSAEHGTFQSEIYDVIDALFYDPATSDRSNAYYLNTTYTSISYANNKYTVSYTGSSGAYVDIRSLTNSVLGKTVNVSVDIETSNVETRLRLINGSTPIASTEYISTDGTLELTGVEIPDTASSIIFRIESRNTQSGDSIKFKNWNVYFV